jgi:hypothetical protein
MHKLNKKGQTEDIFGDMFLAVLIFAVGLIFLIATGSQFNFGVQEGMEKIASIDVKDDLITLLDTKLGEIDLGKEDLGKLNELGVSKDTNLKDFLYILVKNSDSNLFEGDLKRVLKTVFNGYRIKQYHQYGEDLSERLFEFTPDYTFLYKFIDSSGSYIVRVKKSDFARSPPERYPELTVNIVKSLRDDALALDLSKESEECFENSGFSKNHYFYRAFGDAEIKGLNYDGSFNVVLYECIIGRRFK